MDKKAIVIALDAYLGARGKSSLEAMEAAIAAYLNTLVSSSSIDLVDGIVGLFPGADRQALQCLAGLLEKRRSTLPELDAEMGEAEG